MTEIKSELLYSNSNNSSRVGTKNYKLWGKYKNSYLKTQETHQMITDHGRCLTPKKGTVADWDSCLYDFVRREFPAQRVPGGWNSKQKPQTLWLKESYHEASVHKGGLKMWRKFNKEGDTAGDTSALQRNVS